MISATLATGLATNMPRENLFAIPLGNIKLKLKKKQTKKQLIVLNTMTNSSP